MTSQLVLMNQVAVAVASDTLTSMQSMGDTKTWPSQSKMIELPPPALGVVIHCGNVELQGASWRLLVREWIRAGGSNDITTMVNGRQGFVTWLETNAERFAINDVKGVTLRLVAPEAEGGHLDFLVNDLPRDLKSRIAADLSSVKDDEIIAAIDQTTKKCYSGTPLDDISAATARKLLKAADLNVAAIVGARCGLAEGVDFSKSVADALVAFAVTAIRTIATWDVGKVILNFVGFGSAESLGQVARLNIIGYFGGRLRFTVEDIGSTDPTDYAYWIPIAQSSAIKAFQSGMSDDMSDAVFNAAGSSMKDVAGLGDDVIDKTLTSMGEKLTAFSQEQYRGPFFATLGGLGISNLGKFADFLLHLQAFRAATDAGEATVGGHIESLVITPEHGVRWRHRLSDETHDIEESAHAFE